MNLEEPGFRAISLPKLESPRIALWCIGINREYWRFEYDGMLTEAGMFKNLTKFSLCKNEIK